MYRIRFSFAHHCGWADGEATPIVPSEGEHEGEATPVVLSSYGALHVVLVQAKELQLDCQV